MTIEPQVIVQAITTSKVELKITLSGSALCGRLNLSRMLESIEKHVLQGIHWQRKESDIEALLNRYEQLKKFGEGLEFSYYLSSLPGQELNNIKQAIQREGSIRLFECKFEDKVLN